MKLKLLHTVTSAIEDFWGEVLRSSTESISRVVILHVQFTKAEITEGDVASVVQKNVLGFEISKNAHE